MKKKFLLLLLPISALFMTGCSSDEESFEDKVIRKFTYVDSAQKQLEATVEDLTAQIKILKNEVGISDRANFTDKEINFSSIKVLANGAETNSNGDVRISGNTEFKVSVDVLNTTKENISQLICQMYVTYTKDGAYLDRHLLDTRFDVLPASVRKQIEFSNIPAKGSDVDHELTIILKDATGNEITRFTKKIAIK